jgi:hypothetical protein
MLGSSASTELFSFACRIPRPSSSPFLSVAWLRRAIVYPANGLFGIAHCMSGLPGHRGRSNLNLEEKVMAD